jgi:hypothetical protein
MDVSVVDSMLGQSVVDSMSQSPSSLSNKDACLCDSLILTF